MQLVIFYFAAIVAGVSAFAPSKTPMKLRAAPLHENFGLSIGEDPAINTPKEIFGEAAYTSFVEGYAPEGLRVSNGDSKYNIIERVRQLKLLKATADSGLLETLEAKGITLSKLEALLPLVDDFDVLPLLAKNKDLLISIAPLLIEPAPALLPIINSLLKTSPSTFFGLGFVLLSSGAFEVVDNSALLGAPLILLGLPLTAVGAVLSTVDGVLSGSTTFKPRPKSAKKSQSQSKTKIDTSPSVGLFGETTRDVNALSAPKSSGSRPMAQKRRTA